MRMSLSLHKLLKKLMGSQYNTCRIKKDGGNVKEEVDTKSQEKTQVANSSRK